jgi:pimeloyl-ACP methyl ester carboxylesterase
MIARGALALALLAAVSMLIEHVLEARDTAKYAVHDSYVTVSGRRIRYLLEGADKPGPPVLLISGLCGSLEQWDDVQNTLARQSPVFTYDRAGMGFSDPSDAHDALSEADELAAVLKAAKFTSKAVVASYSSGAFLARVFEAKYPEYVAALALVDPSTPGARDEQPPYRPLSYRRAFGRSFIRNTARALFGVARVQQYFEYRHAPALTIGLEKARALDVSFHHWRAALADGWALDRSSDQTKTLAHRVPVPVGVLTTQTRANDRFTYDQQHDIAQNSAQPTFRFIGDVPHTALLFAGSDAATVSFIAVMQRQVRAAAAQ